MCVCERSVWTLIAAQALMVRAQLCDSAEYWSPSNFSWSDPSQPARQYRTHTHTTHTHTHTHLHEYILLISGPEAETVHRSIQIAFPTAQAPCVSSGFWLADGSYCFWLVRRCISFDREYLFKTLTSSIELRWVSHLHHFWCAISFLSDQT